MDSLIKLAIAHNSWIHRGKPPGNGILGTVMAATIRRVSGTNNVGVVMEERKSIEAPAPRSRHLMVAVAAVGVLLLGSVATGQAAAASPFQHQVASHAVLSAAPGEDPLETERLAGADRFATSAKIAQKYLSADVVFVANGIGFADALSAAPAAALLDAPLLLTHRGSIPHMVLEEIERLNPSTIYVIGGTGVISTTVFNQLNALATDSAVRLPGINRYATSMAVFETVWAGDPTETVFLADGRNFPDALSSASAASHEGAPVLLVDGGASSLPAGFEDMLTASGTTDVVLAGGPAVLSAGIEFELSTMPGVSVQRHFGADRYKTSEKMNGAIFDKSPSVYLAVGSGFADALAGAALAGTTDAPLYLVRGHCVPEGVLESIGDLEATKVILLGGTGVLSGAIENLVSCNPKPVVDHTPRITHNENYRPGCGDMALVSWQETSSGGGIRITVPYKYDVTTYPTPTGWGMKLYVCIDQS